MKVKDPSVKIVIIEEPTTVGTEGDFCDSYHCLMELMLRALISQAFEAGKENNSDIEP